MWSLELDIENPGWILFTDASNSLKSTNGQETTIIVGKPGASGYKEGTKTEAIFNQPASFVQFNDSVILVVDRRNHCLRMVDRSTDQTSMFVGNCTVRGSGDGDIYHTLFDDPISIAMHPTDQQEAFVLESGNKALRVVVLADKFVATIIFFPTEDGVIYGGLALHSNWTLYAATNVGLWKVGTRDLAPAADKVTGQTETSGYEDGSLQESRFNNPKQLIIVGDTLAVLDNAIRIVNLTSSTVRSMCYRGSHIPVNLKQPLNCSFQIPNTLQYIPDKQVLYVGDVNGIHKLFYSALKGKVIVFMAHTI